MLSMARLKASAGKGGGGAGGVGKGAEGSTVSVERGEPNDKETLAVPGSPAAIERAVRDVIGPQAAVSSIVAGEILMTLPLDCTHLFAQVSVCKICKIYMCVYMLQLEEGLWFVCLDVHRVVHL